MIALTDISISLQEDIIEFRNKLLMLFLELEFGEMKSVSLTTKVSDLIHQIYFREKNFPIKVGFEDRKSPELFIQIKIPSNFIATLQNNYFFSDAKFIRSEDKKQGEIHLSFPIINPHFNMKKSDIEKIKEKIIVESKSELIRQIKNKNEELHTLLENLNKSSGLIQSEKMRALGVLTAGVAHELNNPMMGILNFVQYCLKKTSEDDKRYEALIDAERETKRCIEIVANLLTFSHLEKEDVLNFKPINLAVLIQRVLKILAYRLRNENITINEKIPQELPSIMGHENRLQQAILNLVINALDAMKTVKNKCLGLTINVNNEHIKINISDTGEGMSEETKQKIFEPFFTTKPTGSGTGLGLSVCMSIIKEHAGDIICRSELGKGTQFSLILPFK